MPYKSRSDLPENVKNVLPDHAQKIYMEAYNTRGTSMMSLKNAAEIARVRKLHTVLRGQRSKTSMKKMKIPESGKKSRLLVPP